MTSSYTELHLKSFYSFGMGASHSHELLARARDFGYHSLALTDTNLCGALEFARLAGSLDIQPITGGELTLTDGTRLVLLTRTRRGYANLSRLFTLANAVDRREPRLDPVHLAHHSEGLVLLTGGREGPVSRLLLDGRRGQAGVLLKDYMEWFGPGLVYVELQRNFLEGDAELVQESVRLAHDLGIHLVASNDVHYHDPERYRLQHALVAARLNTTMERALPHIRPNHHLSLKSSREMTCLLKEIPEAITNTLEIAEQCEFNLASGLGYTLPDPAVPSGYTADSYLKRLCSEAAQRRYGPLTSEVEARLDEEFHLIGKHKLAGFLLLYREIVLLAQKIMEEKGLAHPETPLEERPPGRGRGSSVALLVGYLIGISHVDPLRWGLTLERFIPEDMTTLPDIDLDFPRSLRDELIERVHQHFGPEFAGLTGAVSTYSVKGIIQDLGKALGLPKEDLRMLSKQLHSHDARDLRGEMLELPAFREKVEAPGWRDLLALAPQLMHAPRSLGQHVGGMILSDSPLPEMVPIRESAIKGRYIMDWNKDSTADAGFAKIDLLSLPVLDQIEEALDLVEEREGHRPDISAIDPEDAGVYRMLSEGRSKGVFLLQSPAQLKMGQRLQPRNLLDLAYQVALIRPGVGVQGSAVSKFVDRYRHGVEWDYDHPLERRALERGCGIIVWQEQVVQLISDVAGMTTSEADEIRRAFTRPNSDHLVAMHRLRFLEKAVANGVPPGSRREDIRQGQRPLHVPRVPLPCLRGYRIPGSMAQVPSPPGVLRSPDEQPAHGVLSRRNYQGGRPTLRGALPQPLREPQRGEVHPPQRLVIAGSGQSTGCGRGVGESNRGGEGETWTLLGCRGPRTKDGTQAQGHTLPGHGRGLRRSHPQPPGSPVGCRPACPPSEKRPKGPLHFRGRQHPRPSRFHRPGENGRRVRRHGHLSQGSCDGVREADPEPRCPASP